MNLFDSRESRGEEVLNWKVILNSKGEYAIWPDAQPAPGGWSDAGKSGIKAECEAYVREQEQREDLYYL